LAKLPLKQIFLAIERQILVGKTYLAIAKGLLQTEPRFLGVAPTFFGLTIDGGLELAQMAVARMYDQTPGPVTVLMLLEQAFRKIDSFECSDRKEITAAIERSVATVVELEPVLKAIATRRNEWLAHLDPRTVGNPNALDKKAGLTIPDLDRAFEETEKVVGGLRRLFDGSHGPIRYSGDDDYKTVIRYIDRAKTAEKKTFDAEFEKQFGHPPPQMPEG
jgi:AbiU2